MNSTILPILIAALLCSIAGPAVAQKNCKATKLKQISRLDLNREDFVSVDTIIGSIPFEWYCNCENATQIYGNFDEQGKATGYWRFAAINGTERFAIGTFLNGKMEGRWRDPNYTDQHTWMIYKEGKFVKEIRSMF